MDDKKLGQLLRAKKNAILSRGWRCPDETQLAGYVDARLSESEKNRLESHLAECDFCLGQVAALLRLEGAPLEENVPPALLARAKDLVEAPVTPSVWPVLRWGTIAAATACLAIVATVWIHRQESETPTPPAVLPPAISTPAPPAVAPPVTAPREVRTSKPAGPALVLLAPREGSALAPGEMEIRWAAMPGTLYYELRVMTADGDLVWEGRAEENHTRLLAKVQLIPGGKYFVSVRAFLPEGKTVASPVVGFTARGND